MVDTTPIEPIISAVSGDKTLEKEIPSSLAKKRAVIMYGFFGIVVMVAKRQVWAFELFHLKQAIGRWLSFIFLCVVSAVLFFLPVLKVLAFLPLLAMVVLWFVFVKQARDGKYLTEIKKSPLQLFVGLGTWVLGLFELENKTSSVPDPDFFVWGGSIS